MILKTGTKFIDKNELTWRCSTLHNQHFSTQFTFIQGLSSVLLLGTVKDEGLKELGCDLFLKMAHFQDWYEANSLIFHTACSFWITFEF